jgi:hypothetical protein
MTCLCKFLGGVNLRREPKPGNVISDKLLIILDHTRIATRWNRFLQLGFKGKIVKST